MYVLYMWWNQVPECYSVQLGIDFRIVDCYRFTHFGWLYVLE